MLVVSFCTVLLGTCTFALTDLQTLDAIKA